MLVASTVAGASLWSYASLRARRLRPMRASAGVLGDRTILWLTLGTLVLCVAALVDGIVVVR